MIFNISTSHALLTYAQFLLQECDEKYPEIVIVKVDVDANEVSRSISK